jgi:predicted ATPase with chaperone activity
MRLVIGRDIRRQLAQERQLIERRVVRILKVARTIADLAGESDLSPNIFRRLSSIGRWTETYGHDETA